MRFYEAVYYSAAVAGAYLHSPLLLLAAVILAELSVYLPRRQGQKRGATPGPKTRGRT